MQGRHRFIAPVPLAALVFLGIMMFAPDARAQSVPETGADAAVADSSAALLLQRPVPTPDAALGHLPGVFTYSFRAAGWPDGPSPSGADPGRVNLLVDGHPYDDLIAGRPRYDLAPSILIRGVGLENPTAASATTDRLRVDSPLTRIRYTSTGDGLQEARVLHVQDRTLPVNLGADSTGAPPRMNVLFGYEGAGAANEYPGSRLRRARRVIGRASLRSEHWEFSVLNVANRRRVGAHSGVEPIPGRGPESIYQRLGAVVTDEQHGRRTIRNDLVLSTIGHGSRHSGAADLFWTSQTHSFDNGPSLDRWEIHRFGARLGASTSIGSAARGLMHAPLRIGVDASAALESPGGHIDSLVTGGIGVDGRLLAGAGAEVQALFRSIRVDLRTGADIDDDRVYPDLSLSVEQSRFEASASWSGRSNSWIDYTGFFDYAPAYSESPDVRTFTATAAGRIRVGILSLEPRIAFVRETDAPVRMLDDTATTSSAGYLSGPASRATGTLRIGINDTSDGGLYANMSPSVHMAEMDSRTALDRAWEGAMPDAWIEGRLGFRRLMFKGDFDLDLYVRGRAWTEMRGRRLHTPTGLLMLAPDGSEMVGSSGLTDIVAEAGVRGATLILAWENALSGTSLQAGNLLVPTYPLPAQRLRFGVYWPIRN